jgi:hypothetical protein
MSKEEWQLPTLQYLLNADVLDENDSHQNYSAELVKMVLNADQA